MTIGIRKIRGMKEAHATKLISPHMRNSEHLLAATKTPKTRKDLAAATGIDAQQILEYANRADLARVKGIGEVFSNMLEEAGVDTVKELGKRKPENLHAALLVLNAKGKYGKRSPTPAECTDWVAQAKVLPKMLSY